jgi:hypothetical protein
MDTIQYSYSEVGEADSLGRDYALLVPLNRSCWAPCKWAWWDARVSSGDSDNTGFAARASMPPALALIPAQAIGRTRAETPA